MHYYEENAIFGFFCNSHSIANVSKIDNQANTPAIATSGSLKKETPKYDTEILLKT